MFFCYSHFEFSSPALSSPLPPQSSRIGSESIIVALILFLLFFAHAAIDAALQIHLHHYLARHQSLVRSAVCPNGRLVRTTP